MRLRLQRRVDEVQDFVSRIHASDMKVVIVITGGGSQAIADLLTVPGASRTVLEAIVPYSDAALADLLGSEPAQAASEHTARALAECAAARARELRPQEPTVGIGCTAALVTDRPKRGAHRAFVACGAELRSVTFEKGARTRSEEERIVADLVLELLADVCSAA